MCNDHTVTNNVISKQYSIAMAHLFYPTFGGATESCSFFVKMRSKNNVTEKCLCRVTQASDACK